MKHASHRDDVLASYSLGALIQHVTGLPADACLSLGTQAARLAPKFIQEVSSDNLTHPLLVLMYVDGYLRSVPNVPVVNPIQSMGLEEAHALFASLFT